MARGSNTYFLSDQVDQRPLRHALLFRLIGYLRPYWLGLAALLLLMAAGAALEVAPSEFTLRLIDRHRRERDAAVLLVTHDINPVLANVDRILYIAHGRFTLGTPDENTEFLAALAASLEPS